ncbi:MAG: OadG family protein [Clostridiales bacterium]|nr:OadG family protein [Clostridiales bacterium]
MEMPLFANAVTAAIDWTEVATVVISGVGIVLSVLIVLILVFYAFGALVSKSEKLARQRKEKKAQKAKAQPPAVPLAVKEEAPESAPAVQKADPDGELIAVIAAAVGAHEQSGNFTIKSVKKKNIRPSGGNAWARAAVSQNTRPF